MSHTAYHVKANAPAPASEDPAWRMRLIWPYQERSGNQTGLVRAGSLVPVPGPTHGPRTGKGLLVVAYAKINVRLDCCNGWQSGTVVGSCDARSNPTTTPFFYFSAE